ncbi:MAG: hypothetical protein ACP5VP_00455 [Candidatus Limnocylindrales bacterium]
MAGQSQAFPTEGALAPLPLAQPLDLLAPLEHRVVPTGFPALDAILGPGGLVRAAQVTLRGDVSSGKTTLALRLVAEAQAHGSVVAWLDLARVFDPIEAVARGVDLAWLLVLRASDVTEGLRLAGALVGGRAVEVVVADLPEEMPADWELLLRRLVARARQAGVRLVTIEPPNLVTPLQGALVESAGVGLDLERRAWIRIGRDVVGQRTQVTVTRNRFGPPGRRVELEIRYADEGDRYRGVERLLDIPSPPGSAAPPFPLIVRPPEITIAASTHATPLSRLAAPSTPARARIACASRTDHPGRPSLGARAGARLQPLRAPPGRAQGNASRGRAGART